MYQPGYTRNNYCAVLSYQQTATCSSREGWADAAATAPSTVIIGMEFAVLKEIYSRCHKILAACNVVFLLLFSIWNDYVKLIVVRV